MTADTSKRLAEIKARAEAAEAPYVDDVPFLLEQLKTWRMTSAVFEKAAESAQAKLAASEAATGAMRAALEKAWRDLTNQWHNKPCIGKEESHAAVTAALATTAGTGWLSPEEAARQKAEIRKLHALRIEDGQEAERLRKELEQRETHHKELHNANEQLSASLTSADNRYYLLLDATEKGGLVSEEECARRCREVAEIVLLKCHVCGKPATCVGQYDNMEDGEPACDECCGNGGRLRQLGERCFPLYLEGPLNLDAIIERAAKGGAR